MLILAGDIENPKSHDPEWWEHTSSLADEILYIRGNHEYYKTYYSEYPVIEYPDNVTAVGRMPTMVNVAGLDIYAGTMWTDLSNPLHDWTAKSGMNDYKLIKYSRDRYWFTPEDTTREWQSFKSGLEFFKPEIVVSHHLPSWGSIHPQYKNDELNVAFATEMDTTGVKLWMHGHTHTACDYMKGDTRIVCNPRGYPNEYTEYEIKEIEL